MRPAYRAALWFTGEAPSPSRATPEGEIIIGIVEFSRTVVSQLVPTCSKTGMGAPVLGRLSEGEEAGLGVAEGEGAGRAIAICVRASWHMGWYSLVRVISSIHRAAENERCKGYRPCW